MVSAIFCFSIMDAMVKAVSPETGVLMALWARYSGQFLVVLCLISPRFRRVVRTEFLGLQLARSVLLLGATMFFFFGLSRIGLAEATAMMVMNPLFITIGAAIFLGETLGMRRIAAVVVAFLGAMLVIQPGTDAFQPAALLPLVAAVLYSGYALITRMVGPREDPWTSLFYTALVGGILMSILAPIFWATPSPRAIVLLLVLTGFGTVGHLMLIRAFSSAEASLLAPFGYCGLVFATIIGLVAFAEIPGVTTLLGALVIAGAGIYVWARERQVKSKTAPLNE